MSFKSQVRRNLVVLNTSYIWLIFVLNKAWIAIYYKLCVFIAQSYSPSSHLACFQDILVLLLHILWRGCYVVWYYYHQFLVWLLKLFVSWPHHTALRTMMKVTTVEWSVWIVASVCLCIFLACKEGIDIVLKYYMNVSCIFFFLNKNQFIMVYGGFLPFYFAH